MTIDLANYEEYFLLYADNELSAKDKALVEAFVETHPELKDELDAILQTIVLIDDEAKLHSKGFLYRNDSFINPNNYEEILVQYFDNELSEEEIIATEYFLAQHPHLNKEAELIKRTKISPDKLIVFPDKELLYKKSERVKIAPVIWLRLAAAAVFLGFGFWFRSSYINNTEVNNAPVVNTSTAKPINSPVQKPVVIQDTSNQRSKPAQLAVVQSFPKKETIEQPALKKVLKPVTNVNLKYDVATKETKPSAIRNMNTAASKPVNQSTPERDKDDRSIIVEQLNKGNDVAITSEDYHDEITNSKTAPDNYTSRTAFVEDNENTNYIFNMPEEKFNKTKVGSFLKKVKRNIERRLPFNAIRD